MTILVDLAERAGVFGADRHHISMVRWAENGELREDVFLVTVAQWDRPDVGSPPVGNDRLVADRSSPVATVVGVLQRVADAVNDIIAAENLPTSDNVIALRPGRSTSVDGSPPAPVTSAFPPMRQMHSATPPPDEPPPSALGGGGHR